MGLLDRIAFKQTASEPPETIDVNARQEIVIRWPGQPEVAIPSKALRDLCPCAGCIEEFTGRKLLDPATIPDDIHPTRIDPVGNYAIQFHWSDGHSSGLYTWQTLRTASGPR
ncbi:MAG: DUF971 domain-containing protein [Anaeromyxobacter sp.]|nr:DUF971 domain-containing protein [Anaeromyxobacter sp.]MBL0275730.1 DUF971 domain-containing protein [Anaeromyxobacter sp.]